jgi:hypothetical protein
MAQVTPIGRRALPPEPEVVPAMRLEGRISLVAATSGTGPYDFATETAADLVLGFEGIEGERHYGHLAKADSRVPYLRRGTPMRNTRHVSLVSADELALAAERLELEGVDARSIGANLVIDGIPRLSFLPRGTRLLIEGGAILEITNQNAPCRFAGKVCQDWHGAGRRDIELGFAKAARRLRGLVAAVEHPGRVAAGAKVDALVPEQWIYRG